MKSERICSIFFFHVILSVIFLSSSCTHEADLTSLQEVCFSADVMPVFLNNCTKAGCHDGTGEEGMPLRTYSEIKREVIPGNASASPVYKAIIAKWGQRMPPDKPLSIENRMAIRVWIDQGAEQTTCTDTTGGNGGNGGNGGDTYLARACFTRDILPVVVSHCATSGCHDAVRHAEGYNFTTYSTIRSSVSPGNPSGSKLYSVITTSSGEDKMPPSGSPPLTVVQIDSIKKWIMYGALNENCGEVCDTLNPVTFSTTLWPVLQLTCTGCHSGSAPSGGILLSSYSTVAGLAANGMLMNSLTGSGVTRMPPSGPLTTCRIRQFQIWIKNGYPNN